MIADPASKDAPRDSIVQSPDCPYHASFIPGFERNMQYFRSQHPDWFRGARYQADLCWSGQRDCSTRWRTITSEVEFEGRSVLDIGCAEGWFCRAALSAGALHVVGVDLEVYHIETAEARDPRPYYYRGDYSSFPLNPADIVLYMSVLHYLPLSDRPAALARVRSLTRHVMFFECEEAHRETGPYPLSQQLEDLVRAGFPTLRLLGRTDRNRELIACRID